ncbi:NAD-dependent epimerase/dehydratase family protein [Brevibacterium sp. XM4083]|uniref:NAD-dependent epimerase/dehydratase family protein n=1 Tax=Brevibacterium sp. XM4083 TaxID=2583238 RepID=UPI0011274EF7|nr:NAD-dependent epimerase/dehydratase family protein [Brevibacterium sp. XM4083]MCM1011098.1 NAD-dependent epimerase/dehydratase family protein [Brevibacterium sp. XM4083]
MKITVTGASGLLGSSVARTLVASGHAVTTLQRRPSGVDGARDVLGTVTDPNAVAEAVAGADAVIHLAAKVSLTGDPSEFAGVNIGGTRTLISAAQAAGVTRFVHISSPSVAHTGESIVGDGAGPASPDHARGEYARTKAAGERLALAADAEDFRVLVLRPHLMWGPGDAQLTERVIDRARAGRMPVLGSGAALVDTLFVDNAVEAIVAALTAVDVTHGEALVVTNGQPRPIGELMSQIAIAGGATEPRLRIPVAPALVAGSLVERVWDLSDHDDEPPLTRFLAEQLSTAHWFDQRRTQEVLDWTPRVSIEEGLDLLAAHCAQVGAVEHEDAARA